MPPPSPPKPAASVPKAAGAARTAAAPTAPPSAPKSSAAAAPAPPAAAAAAAAAAASTAGAAAATAASTAAEALPPGRLERQYSIASQKTVSVLDQLKLDVFDLQQRAVRADAIMSKPPAEGLPAKVRGDLAQLHGDANKILATRIDAILTGAQRRGPRIARAGLLSRCASARAGCSLTSLAMRACLQAT